MCTFKRAAQILIASGFQSCIGKYSNHGLKGYMLHVMEVFACSPTSGSETLLGGLLKQLKLSTI